MLIIFTVLGVGAVIAILACVGTYVAQRHNALDDEERAELISLRTLVHNIDRLAHRSRDISPELSVQIDDEIAKHKETLR